MKVRKEGPRKVTIFLVMIVYLFSIIIITASIWSAIYLVTSYQFTQNIQILIFATLLIITLIDMALVQLNKFSPALVLIIIIISPILVLYRLISDKDLIPMDKRKIPLFFKGSIF